MKKGVTELKISLIFPNRNLGRKKKLDAVIPSLGLACLAAVLEKNGFDVNIIDAFAKNYSFDQLLEKMQEIKPDIVGITTNVDIIAHSLITAKLIKKQMPDTYIILGGPHATSTYSQLLSYNFIDLIILGEGEYTLLEVVNRIKENKQVELVKGIAFKRNGEIIKTEDRPLIENLDDLPFPAWHLFPDFKNYRFFTKTARMLPISTSRGCPFDCIFCTKCVFGRNVRFKSPKRVIEEIKHNIDRFNVQEFGIIDDYFSFNPQRAIEICDLIIKNSLDLKFLLANGIRADSISYKLIEKLYKAGCWFVAIGIESGNQDILNKIGKNVNLKQITKAIEICKQKRMVIAGYFVIGLPYENKNTIQDTIKFAKNSKLDLAMFNMAIPIPGTKMFELIERHGKFLFPGQNEYLIGMNTQYDGPYFEIWNLKREDVVKGHKRAFIEFYFRPSKILSLLTKIHSKQQLKYILIYFKNIFLK